MHKKLFRPFSFLFLLLFPFSSFTLPITPITFYQVFFSPEDRLDVQLISYIDREQHQIRIAVYCLTHRQIIKALIRAYKKGVNVEVLVDPFSLKRRFGLEKLVEAGIPLFVWSPLAYQNQQKGKKKRNPLMHDKFCVLGRDKVWTGSFNFTYGASNSNRENAVILESVQAASQYLQEFEKLKKQGGIFYKNYLMQKVDG